MTHANNLKGQQYSVFPQLPMERRKQLLPTSKQARDDGLKATWSKDKLLVENVKHRVVRDATTLSARECFERSTTAEVIRTPPEVLDGSTFQGAKTTVLCPNDVVPALHAIYMDTRVAGASHNSYAYRLKAPTGVIEHYDDDGEFGAGRRILETLRRDDIDNTLVCVTRWLGETHIGPARFDYIVNAAKLALSL